MKGRNFHAGLLILEISSVAYAWTSSIQLSSRSTTRIGYRPLGMSTLEDGSKLVVDLEAFTTSKTRALSSTGHDIEAWKNSFFSCPTEIPPTMLDFPNLPSDFPVGTYFRNGHARFESGDGIRVQHMFDGDGMISATTFDPEQKQILFRNRFVRTEGYQNDIGTRKMSAPGVFGTRVSGGFFKNLFRTDFKNVANTHVLYAPGTKELYALWEAALPYKIDPLTLENDFVMEPKGHNLDGLIPQGEGFAAHYRFDPIANKVVNFFVKLNPSTETTEIKLYEFDANTMKPVRTDEVSAVLDGAALLHDFAITENWCIFSITPANVNKSALFGALLGQGPFAGVVGFDNAAENSSIVLIPRMKHLNKGSASSMRVGQDIRIKVVTVPFHFAFHFVNGFENSDGDVVFDTVQMSQVSIGSNLPMGRPVWETVDFEKDVTSTNYVRYIVNPEDARLVAPPKIIVQNRNTEFPNVPGSLSAKQFRYAYTVGTHKEVNPDPVTGKGSGGLGAILKVDTLTPQSTESFSFLPHEFVGEPCFVPKIGADFRDPNHEDKGYLLVQVVNGIDRTTDLVILDVEGKNALETGPVARLRLPTYIPPGLHGIFVEGLSFTV